MQKLTTILAAAVLFTSSCASVPPAPGTFPAPGGRVQLTMMADSQGLTRFRLEGGLFDGAVLAGTAGKSPDGWTLTPTGMDWFNNWTNGWTRAHFPADGELFLGTGGTLTVVRVPTLDAPDQVKIRYFDKYLTGEEALTRFQNRWDRIQAAAVPLTARFGNLWCPTVESFTVLTEKWLFPEVAGYEKAPAAGQPVRWGESIPWDTGYSQENFPENLRPVRDSGTLFRDFEESPGLWRLTYLWTGLWTVQVPAAVVTIEGAL